MIHLTVKEVVRLVCMKNAAETAMKLEAKNPYEFSIDDLSALTKVCESFNESKVKVRLRAPKTPRKK